MTQHTAIDELTTVTSEEYAAIQQFYAEHMLAVDDEDEAVALGYTEDAVFDTDALPAPLRGRSAIIEGLRKATAPMRESGIRRRHVMGAPTVQRVPGEPDTVRTRVSALVVHTAPGAAPALKRSVVWEDILTRGADGRWRIKARQVRADGGPASSAPR